MMLQLIGHVDFMIEYTQYNEEKKPPKRIDRERNRRK